MLKRQADTADHIQGDLGAPVVLVEYGDYECPHCGHAYPIVKRLHKHFGDRLAFVFRNFPLNEIHPNAEPAAEATEFAATEGKFWEMHDAIFENQSNIGVPLFLELATKFGLSPEAMETALTSEAYRPKVKSDFIGGVRSGVNGTPTFFINGQRHDGGSEYADLLAAIEESLGGR